MTSQGTHNLSSEQAGSVMLCLCWGSFEALAAAVCSKQRICFNIIHILQKMNGVYYDGTSN